MREWTHSEIRAEKFRGQAALRGAGPGAPPGERRCAARRAADPKLEADDLGFRCCSGAPNAAVVVEPELGRPFEKKKLDAATLQKLLAQSPETASIKDDVVFFKEPDAAQTVLARGPGNTQGFGFTVSPLLWKPVAGSEVLLVAARSGKDRSFVVAFHALGNDEYRLAASFIMLNEPGPVALAYDDGLRPRLHFSTCWGCPGETGKILFRHPERVAIVQP